MFVRLGGRVGRLVSAVPNIERPDPVCHRPPQRITLHPPGLVAVGELAARVARLHASPIIPSAFLVCSIHLVVRAGRFEQDSFLLLVANKLKDNA